VELLVAGGLIMVGSDVMLISIPKSWKMLAWNGIRLHIPSEWQVNSVASKYLQVEDGTGPTLELKWQRLKGRVSLKTHLRKLSRLSQAASGVDFQRRPMPEEWRDALTGFEAEAFAWYGVDFRGEGAVLYCKVCRTATLLQFYHKSGQDESSTPLQVLNSFRDHSEDGQVNWDIFGLRAKVPERFVLLSHRLHPGYYVLSFQCGQERLSFKRWGPADVLFRNKELKDWAQERCAELGWDESASLQPCDYHGRPALCGQRLGSNTVVARLWARVTRKRPFGWIRIWHLPTRNQVLGIDAHGLMPLDDGLLEEICSNYEMVPEETAVIH
jgi:hypothetical protein